MMRRKGRGNSKEGLSTESLVGRITKQRGRGITSAVFGTLSQNTSILMSPREV